eukprot:jgi/Galph1/2226/GphlegSOOS_G878.1
MVNKVVTTEFLDHSRDSEAFLEEKKGQENDSSVEEEEFWDFDDSDDDACSYCRTCQLRRRLEKRLAARKMLHQLEANEDHIRRVKEDDKKVEPVEDHRSIEDILKFIGEEGNGEIDKKGGKGGSNSKKEKSSKSGKKRDKAKKKQKDSYKGPESKLKDIHDKKECFQEETLSEKKTNEWSPKGSSRTLPADTQKEANADRFSYTSVGCNNGGSTRENSHKDSNMLAFDDTTDDWEAAIEAEVEAFRKRLEELSAPLKEKRKVEAFHSLPTTLFTRKIFQVKRH